MMKTNTGAAKPRLSELLHRRGQTVAAYAKELGIKSDDMLQMHCTMHGIHKDLTFVPDWTEIHVELVKTAEPKAEKHIHHAKKKPVKPALVDLTSLVHGGVAAAVTESDSANED